MSMIFLLGSEAVELLNPLLKIFKRRGGGGGGLFWLTWIEFWGSHRSSISSPTPSETIKQQKIRNSRLLKPIDYLNTRCATIVQHII